MTGRSRWKFAATAVVEVEELERVGDEQTGSLVSDPLYPIALLKIAMALKRLEPSAEQHFEALLDDVLEGIVIDRDEFRRYLKKHIGRLTAAARGY